MRSIFNNHRVKYILKDNNLDFAAPTVVYNLTNPNWDLSFPSYKTELQNQVTHFGDINRITDPKILYFFNFSSYYLDVKKSIVLELSTRYF